MRFIFSFLKLNRNVLNGPSPILLFSHIVEGGKAGRIETGVEQKKTLNPRLNKAG